MNSKNLTITAFLILSLLIGCSNPEDEFQKAKKKKTQLMPTNHSLMNILPMLKSTVQEC